ncbi:MAG: hypothetical protein QGG24_05080, partial [Vicinamibacterales bacterium]|nr:hypothetical protein [Vicinamibacterales bacterium]
VETVNLDGVLRGHREKVPPMSYLASTRATRPDLAIEELLRDLFHGVTPRRGAVAPRGCTGTTRL